MILEIDIGEGYVPIACLSSFGETESAATLGTTTRENGGWRDGITTSRSKVITGEGLIPIDTAPLSYEDIILLKRNKTQFAWRIDDDEGVGYFSAVDLSVSPGEDARFTFTLEVYGAPVIAGPPSGYTVAWRDNPVTEPTTSFTITSPNLGWTYNYTITSTGGGTPITGSGVITNQFTTIFRGVGGFGDGTLTVEVTMTNASGSGPVVSDDTVLDLPDPPSGYSISFTTNPITSNTAVVQFANAEIGATYIVNVTGVGTTVPQQSGAISSANQQLTFDISGFNNNAILTVTATLTNVAGTGPQVSDTAQKQLTPPSGYAATFDDDPIQNNNTSFRITGGNGIGTGYSYAILSSGGGSPLTGSGSLGATPEVVPINVNSLPNGTLTMNITITSGQGSQTISGVTTTKAV